MIRTLNIPWGFTHPGITYHRDKKVHVYKGKMLPAALQPFAAEDFSFARWVEDEANKHILPPEKGPVKFTPRKHQTEAAKAIARSYSRNWPGFLEADETGLGKTLSTLAGICSIAHAEDYSPTNRAKLLVVCPKGVIPTWVQTLRAYPFASAFLRVMVINYQGLNKLVSMPPEASSAKRRKTKNTQQARKGKSLIDWDYVIFDEAQYLKNYPSSTVSLLGEKVAKLDQKYKRGTSPFVVFSTATPGASPLNLAVMSRILSPIIEPGASVSPSQWGAFLERNGFHVSKGKVDWAWISNPTFGKSSDSPEDRRKFLEREKVVRRKQQQDAKRIGKAFLSKGAPFIKRSPKDIAGWPEQQIEPYPLALTPKQLPLYEEAWSTFRAFLRLPSSRKDSKSALVQSLRYRQKSSLLRVEPTIALVEELVSSGHQVYISCEFVETVDEYRKLLGKLKIPVAEVTGRTTDTRVEERLRFQTGKAKVILSSVVEGVSFHAGESLPDGSTATKTKRFTIIHDIRLNNLNADQSLGRAHRDGQHSLAYFPYFRATIDEKVVKSYTNKRRNMKSMLGAEDSEASFLESLFEKAADDQLD